MALTIRTDSTDYLTATFTTNHDITGRPIDVALPVVNEPPITWYPAEVLGVAAGVADRWVATYRILVGPSGGVTQLSPGMSYDWTVRVTDVTEKPIRKAGQINVTLT